MIDKTCEVCGKEFQVKNYRKDTARFCSQACGGKWHLQNRVMRGPSLVGNKLRQGLRPTNAFTSEQVKGENNPKWVTPQTVTCQQCGGEIVAKPWYIRQRAKYKKIFCSQECFHAHNSGENHWGYLGGPMTYRGRDWLEARKKAVERDRGTCQRCGKVVGDSISVHHVIPFREFADTQTANALDNLTCLCQSCHMKVELLPLR